MWSRRRVSSQLSLINKYYPVGASQRQALTFTGQILVAVLAVAFYACVSARRGSNASMTNRWAVVTKRRNVLFVLSLSFIGDRAPYSKATGFWLPVQACLFAVNFRRYGARSW